ncbi:MAG: hypothetical protein ACREJU_02620, partial [Nitrospiraceae bacterium]
GKEPVAAGTGRAGEKDKEPVAAGSGRVGEKDKEPVAAGSGRVGVLADLGGRVIKLTICTGGGIPLGPCFSTCSGFVSKVR